MQGQIRIQRAERIFEYIRDPPNIRDIRSNAQEQIFETSLHDVAFSATPRIQKGIGAIKGCITVAKTGKLHHVLCRQ